MRTPARLALVLGCIGLGFAAIVLWWQISEADCTAFETYDFWSGSCQFECESDEDCAAKAKRVEAELNAAFETSKVTSHKKPSAKVRTSSKSLESYTTATSGSETDGETYTVQPDGSLRPAAPKPHKHLWDFFRKIVGESTATDSVLSFEIYDDPEVDTAAAVWRSSHDPNKWHVAINEAFKGDRKDLVHTIVHEYAHILTLSGRQVAVGDGRCQRFRLDEGCAGEHSYIQRFHARFWAQFKERIPANDGDNDVEVDRFYARNTTKFVSDYAATNPAEDIAESFTHFVLRPIPTGSSEQVSKIRFFYEFPELVLLRDRMRAAIGADLLRQRHMKSP